MEYLGTSGAGSQAWFEAGLTKSIDFGLHLHQMDGERFAGTFDLGYNILVPITDIAPGVSVGMRDVIGNTELGRAAYAAVSYRIGNVGSMNQDVPTEITIGVWSRRSGLFFGGASLPLTKQFRLIGESDSKYVWAGFEVKPTKDAALKVLVRDGSPAVGLTFFTKF